ncbi:rhomboid-like protein [Gordonia sp. PS3]|uniref:rhomboid-like protein n=1 Tax=Gordonia sp. PS3 TaxID=3248841 RepID=UPI0035BF9594
MTSVRSRWRRGLGAVARWIRSAPVTYAWLVILLATTIVAHRVSPQRLDRILGKRSTNIDNLLHDPVRAIFGSLFWLDGAYWIPYVVGFTVFLVPAERWLGSRRFVVVGLSGHILATLVSQGLVGAEIARGDANPSLTYAIDVGVSYFMASVIGILAYRFPRPWRWVYVAGATVAFCAPLAVAPVTFTAIGHASALLIGFAWYPMARGRPMLDVEATVRRLRQRSGAAAPTVRHRNS